METAPGDGSDGTTALRDRTRRLFQFVSEVYALRNPTPKTISGWRLDIADLPEHPSIELTIPDPSRSGDEEGDAQTLLRCARADTTNPPAVPEELNEWLGRDWLDCGNDPRPQTSRNAVDLTNDETIIENFSDDVTRLAALAAYRIVWDEWAANERVTIASIAIFERLYTLYGLIERERETAELGVACGTLICESAKGAIRYPLFFRSVALLFTADVPEFRIVTSSNTTELNTAILRTLDDVPAFGSLLDDFERQNPHPLASNHTAALLRGIATELSPRGHYYATTSEVEPTTDFAIIDAPLFFVRPRTMGLARAFQGAVDDAATGVIPRSLQKFVGIWDPPAGSQTHSRENGVVEASFNANEDANVLFTKPANSEQLTIAKLLEHDDCVLVQGPPGTGKTHTIANLIGAFLADGKTVLVVSEKAKALKVLRDKVVPELRPLCVSVLDSTEDNKLLKASIESIAARSTTDLPTFVRQAREFEDARSALLAEIRWLRSSILDARRNELKPISRDGAEASPIDAATIVRKGLESNSWLPGPVTLGAPLPLSIAEVLRLYATNEVTSVESERAIDEALPDLGSSPDADEFERLLDEQHALDSIDLRAGKFLWEPAPLEPSAIDTCLSEAEAAIETMLSREAWTKRLALDGITQRDVTHAWKTLFEAIRNVSAFAASGLEKLVSLQPRIADTFEIDRAAEVYGEIAAEVHRTGTTPNFLSLSLRRDWRRAIDGASLGSGIKPKRAEHFAALAHLAQLTKLRADLKRRWNAQVAAIGGPEFTDQLEPEVLAEQYLTLLESSLEWYQMAWLPVAQRMRRCGLRYDAYATEIDARHPSLDAIDRLRALYASLPTLFATEYARRRQSEIGAYFERVSAAMSTWSDAAGIALRAAFRARERGAYRERFLAILDLSGRLGATHERLELLARLESAAPTWASNIRNRSGAHGMATPPGDVTAAWQWSQFSDELEERSRISLPNLMRRLERCRVDLDATTASLADRKAWIAQRQRTTQEQLSALGAFALAKKKLGKGTGKAAPVFAQTAREKLTEASGAVPVWIMPVVKAAEMFKPGVKKFDIVIIDEASQSDITGILPLYLGKKVVVVGDDEQVSPSAVGIEIEPIQQLIEMYLYDIPNGRLFDLRSSLYDIAKIHFSSQAQLREHFRCVPEIIRFSNELSYHGVIKPLREGAADSLSPSVIAHHVESSGAMKQINDDEARWVAALIAAAMEQPEYDGKTFGAISMSGDYQAQRIETYLRRLLSLAELQERRFISGSSSQFQGDERHVMFLSVVDASKEGALHRLAETDGARQRYNVAASRAQDQMWVVHSLDPANDLKTGDLRKRLIEFANDPESLKPNAEIALKNAESPFESAVIERLSAAGYRVTAQQRVGAYRIDIVVEGVSQRLAVECDGERYHKNIEEDIERQSILERVGWTFERIRGSLFYRDPELAMRPVFERLQAMKIEQRALESEPVAGADSELLSRVRRRAAQIVAAMRSPQVADTQQPRGNEQPEPEPEPERERTTIDDEPPAPITKFERSRAEPVSDGVPELVAEPLLESGAEPKDEPVIGTTPDAGYESVVAHIIEPTDELAFSTAPQLRTEVFTDDLPSVTQIRALVQRSKLAGRFPNGQQERLAHLKEIITGGKTLKTAPTRLLTMRLHYALTMIGGEPTL